MDNESGNSRTPSSESGGRSRGNASFDTSSPDAMNEDPKQVRYISRTILPYSLSPESVFDCTKETNPTGANTAPAIIQHTGKPTLSAGLQDQIESDRPDVQMGDTETDSTRTHTATPITEQTTDPILLAGIQDKVEGNSADLRMGEEGLPSLQPFPHSIPPQLSTSASILQEGPVTRKRHRQQHPSPGGASDERNTVVEPASHTLPIAAGTSRTVGQPAKMKARPRIAPRQPPRKRPGSESVPVRVQPKRSARMKTLPDQEITQDETPRIKSAFTVAPVMSVGDVSRSLSLLVVPPLQHRLQTAVVAETHTHPSKNSQLEQRLTDPPDTVSPCIPTEDQSESLRNFEQNVAFAILQDKVKKYEKSLVSMIAEKEYVTEAIETKEKHIKELEHLLEAWATATNDERDKFGDYRSAEAIQATLENQTELLTALQGSHNRLGHDIETGKLRMCMAWESVAAAKAKEKRNE